MKEKVSRPDNTGVWKFNDHRPLLDWLVDAETEMCLYPYGECDSNDFCHVIDTASSMADQAIEKMIASAREKE